MRILLSWLNEFLETPISHSYFMDRIQAVGHEVDSFKYLGEGLENVVVGKIVEFDKHPNADKLFVTKVDIGGENLLSVVTAATNVKKDDYVPLILTGTKLPSGLEIKPVKMRGVLSEGMFGSLSEFGLLETSSGVYVFDKPVPPGDSVIPLMGLDDWLFDIASTPNRGDCLSIYGVAREIALTSDIGLKDVLYDTPLVTSLCHSGLVSPEIEIKAADLCHQYLGAVIKGVKAEPSPDWMKSRLHLMGLRSINNMVDITNYILLETGQPLHAFDYSYLSGGKIVVRTAAANEKLTTLDDTEVTLAPNMLVIADQTTPQALAGVMGGKSSEIKDDTSAILLEVAQFLPSSIRNTSQKVNLKTDSSTRFEHGIDAEMLLPAMSRALNLIKNLNGNAEISPITWMKSKDSATYPRKISIDMRCARINKILGTDISSEKIIGIVNRLGFRTIAHLTDDSFKVEVPSWRCYDVTREADIIEEVARVYGYDLIPETIPHCVAKGELHENDKFKARIRRILTGLGIQEVYSFPLCSADDETLFIEKDFSAIPVENPLTVDQSHLRTSLLASFVNILKYNLSYNKENLSIYDISSVFYKNKEGKRIEQRKVGVLMYGTQWQGLWPQPPANLMTDFFTLKGVLETLINKLNVTDYKLNPVSKDYLHPGVSASIELEGKECGLIGELHPKIAQEMIKGDKRVYYFEIDFETLKQLSNAKNTLYSHLPKFPPAIRDISFFVDDNTTAGKAEDAIKAAGAKYLESLQLIDLYEPQNVEGAKRSMAFRMAFRSEDNTLTDKEIDKDWQKIKKALESINAVVRE